MQTLFQGSALSPLLDAGSMLTVTPSRTQEVVNMQETGKVMAEYIWLGHTGADLKSRTVVLDERPSFPDDLPIAEIDGSSYGQAAEETCEVYLQPRKIFPDPFRGGDHILVLCDTYVPPLVCTAADPWENLQPHTSNYRAACSDVMKQAAHAQPVFTMQQEYNVCSDAPGPSTCFGLGSAPMMIKNATGRSDKAAARLGRDVSELHMRACLAAGLSYSGSHISSCQQYAYKIGPCAGVDAADQLSVSRFLLLRVAEHSQVDINYDLLGKPPGSASGNKCIIQFSTASSRDPISGLSALQQMMDRLHNSSHSLQLLSGPHNAAAAAAGQQSGSWHSSGGLSDPYSLGNVAPRFTVGVGNKHASIMIPTSTLLNRCGPILDRRPPASSDPYLTSMLLVSAACGIPLPASTATAMQLAAALQACNTVRNNMFNKSCRMGLDSSRCPTRSCASFGASAVPSGGSLSGCYNGLSHSGTSGLSNSADSQEVLLSALDKLDGRCGPSTPLMVGGSLIYADDACSDVCSDASSPPMVGSSNTLAGAVNADQEMFYE